jgi:hypothetical protein
MGNFQRTVSGHNFSQYWWHLAPSSGRFRFESRESAIGGALRGLYNATDSISRSIDPSNLAKSWSSARKSHLPCSP